MTLSAQPIYLKDYHAPDFIIEKVSLLFQLFADHTQVDSTMTVTRGPGYHAGAPLILDGEHLALLSVSLDDKLLSSTDYSVDEFALIIPNISTTAEVKISVKIKPHENTALTGLYASENAYCTQCESHGFRRITYFIDRPDNLSLFTVRIEGDHKKYPDLLSNGNPVDQGELPKGRHFVTWEDPFKKPSYLFALVAGNFHCDRDEFVTSSGKKVDLRIYVEKHNAGKTAFAMFSLKEAMRWDEVVYGREYDLDIYMIVAVSDFNMGAMENKGLNIFNDKYILANDDVATDVDYQRIMQVVAHEYFHNWSGNRVTLRDWFQLSLKEGFTVFRDHSFGADKVSPGMCRVEEMLEIQTRQFAEDASPMAHPVRPESYIEMNNFYTATVYEKGSEVIRMLHTLMGPKAYRAACDEYFARFDGQAVTVDDFVNVMQEHTAIDLTQFRRWYSQSGTPIVTVKYEVDSEHHAILIHFSQITPPTSDQAQKLPLHIPIRMSLWNDAGEMVSFALPGADTDTEHVYSLKEPEEILRIEQIEHKVIPSFFRGFSAPVKTDIHDSPDEWFFIATHETDPCARTLAFNKLCLHECFETTEMGELLEPKRLSWFISSVLQSESHEYDMMAHLLTLPSDTFFAEAKAPVPVDGINAWRAHTKRYLAKVHYASFKQLYLALKDDNPAFSVDSMGKRALRQVCLDYLIASGEREAIQFAVQQYQSHLNMTETMSALRALRDTKASERDECLNDFYERFSANGLVIDKWLALQATARRDDVIDTIMHLKNHRAFSLKNPNKTYSLFGAFGMMNFSEFHRIDGKGYALIRDVVIELNAINPQVAARVIKPLIQYRRFDEQRARLMHDALVKIRETKGISRDLFEIVSKSI